MDAWKNGHIEVVKELIERGADINAKNNNKRRRIKDGLHYFMHVQQLITSVL